MKCTAREPQEETVSIPNSHLDRCSSSRLLHPRAVLEGVALRDRAEGAHLGGVAGPPPWAATKDTIE